jgi:hypothetical protein
VMLGALPGRIARSRRQGLGMGDDDDKLHKTEALSTRIKAQIPSHKLGSADTPTIVEALQIRRGHRVQVLSHIR